MWQDAAAVRAAAASANVIGNEQPCRVKLRLWRYSPLPERPSARESQQASPAAAAGAEADGAGNQSAAQAGPATAEPGQQQGSRAPDQASAAQAMDTEPSSSTPAAMHAAQVPAGEIRQSSKVKLLTVRFKTLLCSVSP